MSDAPEGPEALDAILPVSRETRERLSIYVDLLRKWQGSQNLVAPATLPTVWSRHIADSAQAHALRPAARRWVDLGSGAGFPGLVTAILLADAPATSPAPHVTLIESNAGKAAFLRAVIRATEVAADVRNARIEVALRQWSEPVDAVSARALAPFADLLGLARPLLAAGAVGIFHKGREFDTERVAASRAWDVDLLEHPSRVGSGGRIVEVLRAARR